MQRSLYLLLIAFTLVYGCSSDPERPEEQARTLQPYPVHALPLGIRLDSLQTILHGHSALFTPVVEGRLYRIIPLNAYENLGYGAVELFPDSTIRTYYWYTNIEGLTDDEKRYYSLQTQDAQLKPVVDSLTVVLGPATKLEPYPNEQWHNWRNDTATVNLTVVKKEITLTKTGPTEAVAIDTTSEKPVVVAKKPAAKKKAVVKKATPKRKAVTKKPASRKTTTKKRTTTQR